MFLPSLRDRSTGAYSSSGGDLSVDHTRNLPQERLKLSGVQWEGETDEQEEVTVDQKGGGSGEPGGDVE